jgi:hypothetical protein
LAKARGEGVKELVESLLKDPGIFGNVVDDQEQVGYVLLCYVPLHLSRLVLFESDVSLFSVDCPKRIASWLGTGACRGRGRAGK